MTDLDKKVKALEAKQRPVQAIKRSNQNFTDQFAGLNAGLNCITTNAYAPATYLAATTVAGG